MYTGIDTRYYPDKKKVLGTDRKGEDALPELSFHGFSPESVEFLTKERNITERLPNRNTLPSPQLRSEVPAGELGVGERVFGMKSELEKGEPFICFFIAKYI